MPGRLTVYGGVSLPIGADDIAIPSLVGIFFRSWATVIAAALLAIGLTQTGCPAGVQDKAFLAVTLVMCAVTATLYLVMWKVTSKGNMLEQEKRNGKTVLIFHLLAVAYIIEVGLGVWGIVIVTTSTCMLHTELYIVELIVIVAIFFDFIVLGIVLGILVFVSKGKKPKPLDETAYRLLIARALGGLGCLCCGLFGNLDSPMGNQELTWSEISRIIHSFLKDLMTDFTVPDLFTALVLLRAEQRDAEAKRVEKALSSSGAVASPKSPNIRLKNQSFVATTPASGGDAKAVEAMKLFDEFAPYMIGIYGWKLQFYMNPISFICHFPVALARRMIYGNEVEHHIFKATIGVNQKKRQVVYSSFTSYMGEAVPYTITVDHEKHAVVITLRGTMSVGDIATDLLCTPESLQMAARQWGVKDGEKHFTHGGMLAVANRIRTDIEKQQILHRLMRVREETADELRARESVRTLDSHLTTEDRESFLKAMGKNKNAPLPEGLMYSTEVFINDRELSKLDCSSYKLICCGHSLGSCMAAILSLLLRPRFPMIKCLAYSCVSAIFSRELADESEDFIYSCTVGKDIFGRLSWHSAKDLRNKMLDVVRRSKASKPKILLSLLSRRPVAIDELIYADDEVPDELPRRELLAKIDRLKVEDDNLLDKTRMFMPGKILYFEKTHTEIKRGCIRHYSHSEYTPVWIHDRASIQEVQISSRLILDHMPDYLMKVMRESMQRELVSHFNGTKRVLSSGDTTSLSSPPADLNV